MSTTIDLVSRRDFFAAMALHAMISKTPRMTDYSAPECVREVSEVVHPEDVQKIKRQNVFAARRYADMLIEELDRN